MLRKAFPFAFVIAVCGFTFAAVDVDTAAFGANGVVPESATLARDFACGMGPAGLTNDSQSVLSDSGNETMHCQTVADNPGKTTKVTGALCGLVFNGFTTDMRFIWSSGDQADLRCQG
jgi:hypothetical protein